MNPAFQPPLKADDGWRVLHEAACAPYRKVGRFAWHFARGKLGHDPVFRALVERGLAGKGPLRVVDIGCGQGLFASLLHAMGRMQSEGRWPAAWPEAPRDARYSGIELMPRDIERGLAAIGHLQPGPRFIRGDMCVTALPACELVVILDVLHYVDHAAQEEVLTRVRDALQQGIQDVQGAGQDAVQDPVAPPPGRLLLRVGDASSRRGFAISQWVDRTVTRVRGHTVSPTWGRPLAEWAALLQRLGFSVHSVPMSQGTPFANVLLVADLAVPEADA
ncbi:MAG: Methyltransferase type 11 [Variovorax sp.]|nr:Methyltransferase type 11 [Variovorax sp.]